MDSPNALSFDGQCWHVRAWCHRRDQFLDFVLARVLAVLELRMLNIARHLLPERAQVVLLNTEEVNVDLRAVGKAVIP